MNKEHKYDLEFKGDTGKNYGISFYDYPVITPGRKRYETYSIPGMLGSLITDDGSRENATIKCTFSIVSSELHKACRELRRWLEGEGKLIFSDATDCYYKVLAIDSAGMERELYRYGRYTVTFTVIPYEFMTDGDIQVEDLKYNPYDECMPIYYIEGEGVCNLNVNGNIMRANIGQNLTIDSMLMVAYRSDGTMQNTSIAGDYEKLWLPHGKNSISITKGFRLKIKPKWGYFL